MVGAEGMKILILTTLGCWKRHFQEQNYIENYFYLLKVLKLLLKNVEEILFGQIFWGAHTGQTAPKQVWVCWCCHLYPGLDVLNHYASIADNSSYAFKISIRNLKFH